MAVTINGTTGIANVDGSAGSPAFRNTDSNSGLAGSSDQVLISTAGSERLRVASAGQIGIGGANYGSDGHVLTSTGGSSAPAWEAVAGGKVVQIVQGQTDTQYTTTSSSFQDTDCTVAITTNSSASKVLIMGNPFVGIRSENGTDAYGKLQLLRGSTALRQGFWGAWMGNTSGLTTNHYHSPAFTHLDAGVSTGTSYTYKIKYCLSSSSTQAQFNPHAGNGGSHITAIEILT